MQVFTLEVSSDLNNLARVASFVENAAREMRLTERQFDDVHMAVDEAVTNVIEHAYGGRRDGRISIVLRHEPKRLVVEIRDFGKSFDPSKIKEPDIKSPLGKREIGGLGIFFMKKLMDKVEFTTEPGGGNLTRMTKKLK